MYSYYIVVCVKNPTKTALTICIKKNNNTRAPNKKNINKLQITLVNIHRCPLVVMVSLLYILFRYNNIIYDIVDLRPLRGIKILGSRAMYTDDAVI